MSPGWLACAWSMARAVSCGQVSGVVSSRWCIWTGCCWVGVCMSGALSCWQIVVVSIVADIRMIRRSGRRICCAWRVSASAVSAKRFRSWNSSNMIAPMPSSVGSAMSRRVRIPSVSTSICVCGERRESNRMVYPMVCPRGCEMSWASRWAICRAASRRGSSMRILLLGGVSVGSMVSGRSVDLPAPGGAVMTSRGDCWSARLTCGAIW